MNKLIKKPEEIRAIREGGKILNSILKKVGQEIKPGVNTSDLEALACRLAEEAGARPAFKDYPMGGGIFFPDMLCISINDEVVHGTATPGRILNSGDIVDIDLGIIRVIKPGLKMAVLGKVIQDHAERHGYGVVRDLVGHGVGYLAHEEPAVFNYEIPDHDPENIVLQEGMVLAVEPMINSGTWRIKIDPLNKFTIKTADGSLSAHFEHTILVTATGCEILTLE
ncbi:MAG: M24 family metallopeptidase [Candidatus Falkowbacteria bacterium]|nr:M24 family metallopeptidase [Candidatus Falkowbacteria bacterium]